MTQTTKTKVKYWFFLVIGIFLLSMQAYKYFTNTLEINPQEGAVLFVGLMFILKPTALPNIILKITGKK